MAALRVEPAAPASHLDEQLRRCKAGRAIRVQALQRPHHSFGAKRVGVTERTAAEWWKPDTEHRADIAITRGAKDAILEAVHESTVPGHEILYYAAMFTAFLTAFYMFRLFFVVFTGSPRDHHAHDHAHESPLTMTGPLMILAVLSVSAGWLNWPGKYAYSHFFSHGEGHHFGPETFGPLL